MYEKEKEMEKTTCEDMGICEGTRPPKSDPQDYDRVIEIISSSVMAASDLISGIEGRLEYQEFVEGQAEEPAGPERVTMIDHLEQIGGVLFDNNRRLKRLASQLECLGSMKVYVAKGGQ